MVWFYRISFLVYGVALTAITWFGWMPDPKFVATAAFLGAMLGCSTRFTE